MPTAAPSTRRASAAPVVQATPVAPLPSPAAIVESVAERIDSRLASTRAAKLVVYRAAVKDAANGKSPSETVMTDLADAMDHLEIAMDDLRKDIAAMRELPVREAEYAEAVAEIKKLAELEPKLRDRAREAKEQADSLAKEFLVVQGRQKVMASQAENLGALRNRNPRLFAETWPLAQETEQARPAAIPIGEPRDACKSPWSTAAEPQAEPVPAARWANVPPHGVRVLGVPAKVTDGVPMTSADFDKIDADMQAERDRIAASRTVIVA